MVTPELVARARALPVAALAEAAGGLGLVAPSVRPMVYAGRIAGPAYTVKCRPGDDAAVIAAIDSAAAGDVLVIDAGAGGGAAVWGAAASLAAYRRELAGMVTNGAVREIEELGRIGFAVFAAAILARPAARSHPGWSQIAIAVGEVPVHAGDLVVADEDGVLALAAARAADTVLQATRLRARDKVALERVEAGEPLSAVLAAAKGGTGPAA